MGFIALYLMSYSFMMGFAHVKDRAEAFKVAMDYVKSCMTAEKVRSVLKENFYYVPSVKAGYSCSGKAQDREQNPQLASLAYTADYFWMKNLFTYRFLYWKQYELLGIVMMPVGEVCEERPLWITFQNYTDQDYAFSEWKIGHIPFFEHIAEKVEAMTEKDMYAEMYEEDPGYYTMEEIEKSLDYMKRSFCYKQIVKALCLEIWVEGLPEEHISYEIFALNGITSDKYDMEYHLILKSLLKQHSTEIPG